MTMNPPLFETFCKERNLSEGSIKVYSHALRKYTTFNGMTLQELITEADTEEEDRIRWKRRTLKSRLIDYRRYLIECGYAKETITTMMKRVTTFYRHHEIEIHHLPQVNIKNVVEVKIPSHEDLKKAVTTSKPLMKALILFLSSSGLSKIDCLKLTIEDFITATKEYHNSKKIDDVLDELDGQDDIIPTFSLTRTKTGKYHHTFCSPEAVKAIINYLRSRTDHLIYTSKLFKISYHWLTNKFEELNEQLQLGVTEGNNFGVLRCHTLRKYHATTLRNDGLSIDLINSMQGKAKNKVDSAYFVDSPESLKAHYIQHVNSLIINSEVTNIDVKSPEYLELEEENKILREQNSRIDNLEKLVLGNIDQGKLRELNKIL